MTVKNSKKLGLLLVGIITAALCLTAVGEELSEEEKAKQREKKREMIKAAKEQLNNTTWEITLTESGAGEKRKTMEDTLRFVNGKIESEKLVLELIFGNVASKVFKEAKGICQIKRVEITKSRILKG